MAQSARYRICRALLPITLLRRMRLVPNSLKVASSRIKSHQVSSTFYEESKMSVELFNRYRKYLCVCEDIDLSLDISRMKFDDNFFASMSAQFSRAFDEMAKLEAGAIANPDENRRVGHYWLRNPSIAPDAEIRREIEEVRENVKKFAKRVHTGDLRAPNGEKYTDLLVIGIGGSALGPQWIASALSTQNDAMRVHFLDNTDPEGIEQTLTAIQHLETLLVVVISKSGSTPETRNGMLSTDAFLRSRGLDLAQRAVAITGKGSKLDVMATQENWVARFPMWDWVGGRTSELSAVGLLPAALQGIDIDALCQGAALCDAHTNVRDIAKNPAMLMAAMWFYATDGKGRRDLVMLPYKDKLLLFSRYLQQLIMESLGKALDLDGNRVNQGLTVYGNKGSTDQHAYVQQLRDGINNFFVTFIDVLEYGAPAIEVDDRVTPGDYLHGFLLGTRQALAESARESMTITVRRIDARTIGALIALFERTVGYYASFIHINAYHQPGVEAGKKAASKILAIQTRILDALSTTPATAHQIATTTDLLGDEETVTRILTYLAANARINASSNNPYDFDRTFTRL